MLKQILIVITCTFLFGHESAFATGGWITQQSGTNLKLNKVLFINSLAGWIVGDAGKILHTTNGGENWFNQSSNYGRPLSSIYFLNKDTGWIAGGEFNLESFSYIVILKTTNAGTNWVIQYDNFHFYNTLKSIWFRDNNTGYASGNGGSGSSSTGILMKTTNSGVTWLNANQEFFSSSNMQFTDSLNGWIIGNYFSDFGVDSSFLIHSQNGGLNWANLHSHQKVNLTSSYFLNNSTGWIGGRDRQEKQSESIIEITNDGGSNWERILLPLYNDPNSIFFNDSQNGWCSSGQIFHSTNGGLSWLSQYPSDGYELLSICFTDSLNGWIVGENGIIYSTKNGGLTVTPQLNTAPVDFSLSQNYPNPFNPSTKINYSVPVSQSIQLKVYDILGNEVATLVDQKQNAGSYSVEFDGSKLSSGIYFYKLEAGSFSQTRRMIMLK